MGTSSTERSRHSSPPTALARGLSLSPLPDLLTPSPPALRAGWTAASRGGGETHPPCPVRRSISRNAPFRPGAPAFGPPKRGEAARRPASSSSPLPQRVHLLSTRCHPPPAGRVSPPAESLLLLAGAATALPAGPNFSRSPHLWPLPPPRTPCPTRSGSWRFSLCLRRLFRLLQQIQHDLIGDASGPQADIDGFVGATVLFPAFIRGQIGAR
jgi:hypothetical protein